MQSLRSKRSWTVIASVFAVCGCTILVPDDDGVTVMFYNAQNVFDDVHQGTEYDDFTPARGWDRTDYERRLQAVGRAVLSADPKPDVLVLLEIENAAVLDRLVREQLVDLALGYHAFAGAPRSAVGIGIASRYPIERLRSHLPGGGTVAGSRPILEAEIATAHATLYVFGNHWKSKRGGAAATEALRIEAAALLNARVRAVRAADPNAPIVVGGDFNVSPDEIVRVAGAYPTAILSAPWLAQSLATGSVTWLAKADLARHLIVGAPGDRWAELALPPPLSNGWDLTDAPGSYHYNGRWERIDAVYYDLGPHGSAAFTTESFHVVATQATAGADLIPDGARGGDASDHLPVMLTIVPSSGPDPSGL